MSGRIELAAQELVDRHGDPLNNIEDSVLWCANSEKPLQGPQYFRRIPNLSNPFATTNLATSVPKPLPHRGNAPMTIKNRASPRSGTGSRNPDNPTNEPSTSMAHGH